MVIDGRWRSRGGGCSGTWVIVMVFSGMRFRRGSWRAVRRRRSERVDEKEGMGGGEIVVVGVLGDASEV